MQGLILLSVLLSLFVALGLLAEEVNGPVRVVIGVAVIIMTGWYLIF
jgi:hypothetical protein